MFIAISSFKVGGLCGAHVLRGRKLEPSEALLFHLARDHTVNASNEKRGKGGCSGSIKE